MGIGEWLAFCSLLIMIVGVLLKLNYDKAEITTHLNTVIKWKERMEAMELLTHSQHEKEKTDCRTEIYKDISRIEKRIEEFFRVVEDQNKKINCIDNNTVRIITLIENLKVENNNTNNWKA